MLSENFFPKAAMIRGEWISPLSSWLLALSQTGGKKRYYLPKEISRQKKINSSIVNSFKENMQRENKTCLQLNPFVWWYPDVASKARSGCDEQKCSVSRRRRLQLASESSVLMLRCSLLVCHCQWSPSWLMPKTKLVPVWCWRRYPSDES